MLKARRVGLPIRRMRFGIATTTEHPAVTFAVDPARDNVVRQGDGQMEPASWRHSLPLAAIPSPFFIRQIPLLFLAPNRAHLDVHDPL